MTTVEIRFTPTANRHLVKSTRVRRMVSQETGELESNGELIDRAAAKLFGRGCFVHADPSLPGLGQVFRPAPLGGANSVTGRLRIELR